MSFLNNRRIKGGSNEGSGDAAAIGGVESVRSSAETGSAWFLPEGNDDELRVLRSVLNVVRDDRHVPEIQRGVDLIHKVQRGRLCAKNRFQSKR